MGRDEFLESHGFSISPETEIEKWRENKVNVQDAEAKRSGMAPKTENEFVKECPEHGRYHGEFSCVSENVGTIEESDSKCPICGAECKIISLIPYEINEYRPMSREEWEEY